MVPLSQKINTFVAKLLHKQRKTNMKRISIIGLLLCMALYTMGQGRRILFIGDSITDGAWGGGKGNSKERNETDLNHVFGHGFMAICAYKLQGNYPEKEYQFFNRGISGDNIPGLAKRWKEDVLDMHPDVLSVLVGINDIFRSDYNVAEWEKMYRGLLKEARQANPHLDIILCTPFTENTGNWKEEEFQLRRKEIDLCGQAVRRLAKEYNAVLLPYDEMFDRLLQKHKSLPARYWIWDSVHPTPAGHQKMADMWLKAFKKL